MTTPKPYFERDGQTIYFGDAREILPTLGKFDLTLTDPPYGIGDRMQGGTWGAADKYADFRCWDVAPDAEMMAACLCAARNTIIWGGNYFALPVYRCWLVWDKQNAVATMADVELAWTNFDRPAKRLSLPVGVHSYGHPTEKPLPLFKWCLGFAPNAQTIIDPYMGSGTTLIAARDCGMKATGIEISEAYCATTARRLEQGVINFA